MNLYDQAEIDDLIPQRIACGWNYEMERILGWRDQMERGEKYLFWITIPDPVGVDITTMPSTEAGLTSSSANNQSVVSSTLPESYVKAGHVALASKADPPHPQLARQDKSVLTISTFFILPTYRSGGLGRSVMDAMESMATKSPYGSEKCEAIAIDTLSKKYFDRSRPEFEMMKSFLTVDGRGEEFVPSNQLWYERRGYRKFHEEPRYDAPLPDNKAFQLDAVFLRKEL